MPKFTTKKGTLIEVDTNDKQYIFQLEDGSRLGVEVPRYYLDEDRAKRHLNKKHVIILKDSQFFRLTVERE